MGALEQEFGVPFPGQILSGDRWTRTGLKDDGKPFDWVHTFGREAPRVLDLGCGNGRYLIGSALTRPGHDHLGIDLVQRAVDFAAHRANKRGIANARFVTADADIWTRERLAPGTLDEVHLYHPQPYYDPEARARRLVTGPFLERLWELLKPGGLLVLQTDNKAYWRYLSEAVRFRFEPRALPGPWPDAPRGRTRREIVARMKGLAVWRMEARRRDLPLPGAAKDPDFNADRPRFRKARRDG